MVSDDFLPAATGVGTHIKLLAPVAMEEGMRFAIREGGRTIGAGTVSEIIK